MIRILAVMIFAILFGCSQDPKPEERIINVTGIELTPDEEQYIKEHPVITWAVDNRPPVLYKNKNGEMAGRVPEYLKIITRATGLIFKPVTVADLPEALLAVKEGQIDLVTGVRPTSDRSGYLGFTAPFAESKAVFLFRVADMPKVPLRVGVLKGEAAIEYLRTNFPTIQIVETTSHAEAIELLHKGLVDAAIMHEDPADYIIHKQKKPLYKVQTDFTYQSSFGFRRDEVILGSIISKVILSISLEDKNYINDAWRRDLKE